VTPTKQTKKYFRPGWNEDFNNRDKAISGLDRKKNLNNSREECFRPG
jgi:hypothetical protein